MRILLFLVALPLATSSITKAWQWAWGEKPDALLSKQVDRSLTVTEGAIAVAVFFAPYALAAGVVAAMYAVLCVGVLVLRQTRGEVACGCFGSSTKAVLSFRLAALDGALAVAGLALAVTAGAEAPLPAAMSITLLLGAATVALTVPSFWRLYTHTKRLADPYRAWAKGYPDLRVDVSRNGKAAVHG